MNPERAQMLREIRREFCAETTGRQCFSAEKCARDEYMCGEFLSNLEDLFAEAEAQTEPENENELP